MAQLRLGYPEIQRSGAEVLQITHNTPAEAERYFRYHSVPYPYLCDPDRAVHEAYGLPLQSIGPLDPLKATATAALDFVRRGERTEAPFPFFARYGPTKDSPQAVLVVDREGIVRRAVRAGPNAELPSNAEILRWLADVG